MTRGASGALSAKEKQRERCRRHYATHKEEVKARSRRRYAANKEALREYQRQYYAAEPHRYIETARRRRALKANAPQGDPSEAAAYAEILCEGICELCGAHGPIHIDHIEAISTGGEHGWENFAGLCQSCNSSKHDKSLLTHMIDALPC